MAVYLQQKTYRFSKNTGFDAVKFQKRTPEVTTPKSKAGIIREILHGVKLHI